MRCVLLLFEFDAVINERRDVYSYSYTETVVSHGVNLGNKLAEEPAQKPVLDLRAKARTKFGERILGR